MLTDETYTEALSYITTLIDELEDLDPSAAGYLSLLEYAVEEIQVNISAAKCEIGDEDEDEE